MAALSFQEKFKHKVSVMGRQGELSMSQARPIAALLPESKSHFRAAAAAVIQGITPVQPSETHLSLQQESKEDFPVFAKPIRITRKVISDTFSECAAPVRLMVAEVAMSEHAVVGDHKVSHSIDFQRPVRDTTQPLYPPLSLKAPSKDSVHNHRKQIKSADFTPYTLQDYRKIKPSKYYFLGGLGPVNKENPEWKFRFQLQHRRVEYGKRVLRSAKEGTPTPSMLRYSPSEEPQ